MTAVHADPRRMPALPAGGEQRFVVHGVRWKDYVVLREALDIPGLRMTFLEGALELMSPSTDREVQKKVIARLIELDALERGVALYAYGNATFRREAKERGFEPDECWTIGRTLTDVPDVALEVVMTSGGLPKLEVYRGLGVPEVWFWTPEGFSLHALDGDTYRSIERSAFLPDLDFDALARFVRLGDQHAAVTGYRDWLREHGK